MRALRRAIKRLTSWTRQQRDEERLRLEIEEHIAMQTADNVRAGLSPGEARRQAALKFGGVEAVRESYRDQRGLPFLEILIQDTRHALRRLRKAPAFTITTVLTLALGIGATTSIFTLAYAVIFKSLAVPNPSELYRLGKESRCCDQGGFSQEKEFSLVSYDLYKYFRSNTNDFAELAAFSAGEPSFGVRRSHSTDPALSFPGEFVSGNYFEMFGVKAYAGRTITAQDDRAGAPLIALMSYRLWSQNYGSDPSVIGGTFDLNQKSFTVVGITPPEFFGDTLRQTPPDFFLPLGTEPFVEADADLNKVNLHWLDVIGRIRPGAKPTAIEAQMRLELKQWLRSHWADMNANERAVFPVQTVFLSPGGAGISRMREAYEQWLQILMIVTCFVLLIVCANIASLALVRGIQRRQQTSLSMALGVRTWRLIRQTLTESILLSLAGGAAGLLIAFAGTRLILHLAFPPVAGMAAIPISASPSLPVLLFAFGVSLLTGVAFGIAPAWVATKVDPIEALRGASRSTGRTSSLPRNALVILQAALSFTLLCASGLLTAALNHLQNQDFGFSQDRRTIVSVNPRLAGYGRDQLTPLYQRIQDSLGGIPGVSAVALCLDSPFSGNTWGGGVWIDGRPNPGPNDDNLASWNRVTASYFDVIGTPIIRGRGITQQDTATSRHVAVINENFARKFFKGQDPIGKHFGRSESGSSRLYEVIGVTKDARYMTFRLNEPVLPSFFLPESQHDITGNPPAEVSPSSHFLHDALIFTRPGATVSLAQVRHAMASVDPNLPVISIEPLREQVAIQFTQQRLIARLTSFFGLLSLILASIGLYGVTASNLGRRTSEIGVRMALGATRKNVVALVLRGAFSLILSGLLAGIPLAFAAGKFLGNQLYGLNAYNPGVILLAVATLGISALVASLIPAIRASSISPLEALRTE